MTDNKPNLILKNGEVYTVDPDRSWAQAIAERPAVKRAIELPLKPIG